MLRNQNPTSPTSKSFKFASLHIKTVQILYLGHQPKCHAGAPNSGRLSRSSVSELRETAEILVGACRSLGPKLLTFISKSERGDRDRASPARSLHCSLASTAVSKVKKALGLKMASASSRGTKRAATTGELLRVQMRISEQRDTRIRRALLRIAAGQVLNFWTLVAYSLIYIHY